jgi:hypothetical protein
MKIAGRGCALVVLMLAGLAGAPAAVGETLDQPTLETMVRDANTRMPQMVDTETRVDKVGAGEQELIYYATLVNKRAADVDRAAFSEAMERRLRATACQTPGVSKFLAAGISVTTQYQSSDGQLVARITLPRYLCRSGAGK